MTSPLDIPLAALSLSPRALRALAAAGHRTLADVAPLTWADLRRIPDLGPVGQRRIVALVKERQRAAAFAMIAQGRSLRQVARELGVSHECVRKWLLEANK